jgi:predicted nuclease of predicted toxin-antitoxin system
VIITADLDYPRLLALAPAERPGLILFRGGNYSEEEVKERLGHALALTTDEELPTSLITIERWHIRKRRLPIKAH